MGSREGVREIGRRVCIEEAPVKTEKASPRSKAEGRSGTQTIERAVELLREISAGGHFGWQLSDLATRCHLRKSTAHRILTCLVRERLVRQRPGDRHYMPGPMLFELGLSSLPERGELQYAARCRLEALAERTAGVAFLFFRSGDEYVCAARVGSTRLDAKPCAVFPGTRKPLITAVGGAALLLALPEAEARSTVRRNLANVGRYSETSIKGMRRMMDRSFAEGFAINAGDILPGVNAFGLALKDSTGTPFASVSLAGPARNFPLERMSEIRSLLAAAAEGLGAAPS